MFSFLAPQVMCNIYMPLGPSIKISCFPNMVLEPRFRSPDAATRPYDPLDFFSRSIYSSLGRSRLPLSFAGHLPPSCFAGSKLVTSAPMTCACTAVIACMDQSPPRLVGYCAAFAPVRQIGLPRPAPDRCACCCVQAAVL